jgi:hypothetical protein
VAQCLSLAGDWNRRRVLSAHLDHLAIVRGSYQSGTVYDLAWFVPFLCYAAAALAAPASPAESEVIEAPSAPLHVLVSAVPVFLIPLTGYGALYLQPLGPPTIRSVRC